jgi:hypothetical protein
MLIIVIIHLFLVNTKEAHVVLSVCLVVLLGVFARLPSGGARHAVDRVKTPFSGAGRPERRFSSAAPPPQH